MSTELVHRSLSSSLVLVRCAQAINQLLLSLDDILIINQILHNDTTRHASSHHLFELLGMRLRHHLLTVIKQLILLYKHQLKFLASNLLNCVFDISRAIRSWAKEGPVMGTGLGG